MKPYCFVLLSSLATVLASNVLELTPENFDDEVLNNGKPSLVEFFAPWCGRMLFSRGLVSLILTYGADCKSLAPIYEQLADSFASQRDKVVIAKVDADSHRSLGQRFGVQGFPTLKYFDGKSPEPSPYESKRDLESLQNYITEKTGIKPKIKKEPSNHVVVLSDANFSEIVNGNKNVLVEFYAPWCGHCKKLAPIYDKIAWIFAEESDVVVAKLDADAPSGKGSAQNYAVTGFPTLKWFPKGSIDPEDYSGSRTENDLVAYINTHAGTKRTTNGGLTELAGRIEQIDNALEKLIKGDDSTLKLVTEEVKELAENSKDITAAYYIKVLDKIAQRADYVEKEHSRLERILEKGGLAQSKVDDITVRKNILKQFYSSKDTVKDEL